MGNFYTDVIRHDQRVSARSRVAALDLLEPVTRSRVLQILAAARVAGHELMVFETYRSPGRQEELYERGVSKLKTVGVHAYGLACDLVKFIGGEPSWKGDFSFLGTLAKTYGLIWGGDWGSPGTQHHFVDAVHVQRIRVEHQHALFSGAFYPDESYDPYDPGSRPTAEQDDIVTAPVRVA